MKKGNFVLFEQVQNTIVVLLDHRVFAGNHFGDVHFYALYLNAVVGKVVVGVVKMLRRLQQSFGRNTSHIGTSAARCGAALVVFPLVNTGHLKTQLRCTDGRNITTGATTNHYYVKLFTHEKSIQCGISSTFWRVKYQITSERGLPMPLSWLPSPARPRDRQ